MAASDLELILLYLHCNLRGDQNTSKSSVHLEIDIPILTSVIVVCRFIYLVRFICNHFVSM